MRIGHQPVHLLANRIGDQLNMGMPVAYSSHMVPRIFSGYDHMIGKPREYIFYQVEQRLLIFGNGEIAMEQDIFTLARCGGDVLVHLKCRNMDAVPVFLIEVGGVGSRDREQLICPLKMLFVMCQLSGLAGQKKLFEQFSFAARQHSVVFVLDIMGSYKHFLSRFNAAVEQQGGVHSLEEHRMRIVQQVMFQLIRLPGDNNIGQLVEKKADPAFALVVMNLEAEFFECRCRLPFIKKGMQDNPHALFADRFQFIIYVNDTAVIRRVGNVKSNNMQVFRVRIFHTAFRQL